MTYEFEFENIKVLCDKRIPKEEAIEYVKEEKGRNNKLTVVKTEIKLSDDDTVNVKSSYWDIITRLRRITGYVVPMKSFNDAKKSEAQARVGHFE